jgi:DNA-binding LacI/PurR family transcriptional regulator/DNA-binding CsgD family transcriptional regulator/PAS domain-containing protein
MSNNVISSQRRTIGMLINQLDGNYQSQLWKGLQKLAEERNVNLLYFVGKSLMSPIGNECYHNFVYNMAKLPYLDGLVVSTSTITLFADPQATFLDHFDNMPMVSLSQPLSRCPSILIDGKNAMKTIVKHLMEVHGIDDFAFIRGPFGFADADGRFQGFSEALMEHGLAIEQNRIFVGDFSFGAGQQAVYEWVRTLQKFPRAVVCSNDEMAMGVLSALKEIGLRIPEDVVVTGFDDIDQAHHLRPSLTTAHQPIFNLSYRAGEILLDILDVKQVPMQTVLECPVMIRRSCGCEDDVSVSGGNFSFGGISFNQLETEGETALKKDLEWHQIGEHLQGVAYREFVDSLTKHIDQGEEDIAFWVPFLAKLETRILKSVENRQDYELVKDLVNRAGRVVFEHLADLGNDKYLEVSDVLWKLRRIIAHFGASHTMQQLFDNIRESFPSLGIQSVYITLFDQPFIQPTVKDPLPPTSQLAVALSLPQRIILPGHPAFSTELLLPVSVLPLGRRYTLFVLPLITDTHADGVLVIEPGVTLEIAYGMLAEQIVNALENTRRIDQLEVAEQKLTFALENLRKSEERYREMAYFLPTIILETDLSLQFSYANQACLSLFEVATDTDVKSLNLLQFIHPEDRDRFFSSLSRIVVGELPDLNEIRLNSKNGQSLSILSRPSLIQKDNKIEGIRWSALDAKTLFASAFKPDSEFYERYNVSKREKEVVELILQGYKLREVADLLCISLKTVKAHVTSVYSRCDVKTREEFLNLVKNHLAVRYGHAAFRFSLISQILRD